jgi:lactoylglutathione lyase
MKVKPVILFFLFAFTILISNNTTAQMKKAPILNHVALYVYNLQKSADFYKNIIGIESIPEPFHDGRHEWFRIGAHSQLHLIGGAKSISAHDKDSHLCFSVVSMEDFTENLNKNKVWYGNWPGEANKITTRPDGIKQIYFKDPDGYWIEINNDRY